MLLGRPPLAVRSHGAFIITVVDFPRMLKCRSVMRNEEMSGYKDWIAILMDGLTAPYGCPQQFSWLPRNLHRTVGNELTGPPAAGGLGQLCH